MTCLYKTNLLQRTVFVRHYDKRRYKREQQKQKSLLDQDTTTFEEAIKALRVCFF